MSNATFGQAGHTLTVIGQQEPTAEHLKTLHDGYLVDLLRAIRLGTVPARDTFQKFLGLMPELNIWKTVKLGVHKTPAEYEKVLMPKDGPLRLGNFARQILNKITVSQTVVEVDLCVKTIAELGFKGSARYEEIGKRIVEIGGALCPAEVGPALREQYDVQSYGEWNLIAMEAIPGSDGVLSVFGVVHGSGGRWLSTRGGSPSIVCSSDDRVVFVLPRKLEF